jgi:hypothetical protein
MNRPQDKSGAADPIGQGRTIQVEALPGIDLRLPIQRQVIGIFGHEHLRDRRLGRQSAFDQPRRRWRLHHHVLARPAGIFGSPHDDHAELRRYDVEPLAGILADPMKRIAAAPAGMVIDIDHDLHARQMRWKRSPVHAALGRSLGSLGRIGCFSLGLAARGNLLNLFQAEQHLIFRQRLRTPSEAMTL